MQPDAWTSATYRSSFGPKGQWVALRSLFEGRDLTEVDAGWLRKTTSSEVDGKMTDILIAWQRADRGDQGSIVVDTKSEALIARNLIQALEGEIAAIKDGTLSEEKAREIAKFRAMQLNTVRLVLDAVRLENATQQRRVEMTADERTTPPNTQTISQKKEDFKP